jgi:uncharacterized protein YjbJ (UPF0337 family)
MRPPRRAEEAGKEQRAEGKLEKAAADAQQRLEGTKEEVVGKAREKLGGTLANTEETLKGKAEQAKARTSLRCETKLRHFGQIKTNMRTNFQPKSSQVLQ